MPTGSRANKNAKREVYEEAKPILISRREEPALEKACAGGDKKACRRLAEIRASRLPTYIKK